MSRSSTGLGRQYRNRPVSFQWVGSARKKGSSVLIEAAAELARRGIWFELVLVGDGELRGEIETAIAHHRLGDRVESRGGPTEICVKQEITAARALVLPSFAEGLPVVLMEAFALGRPVISTFVAGIPELVVPADRGGWCRPDRWRLSPERCAKLSQPARTISIRWLRMARVACATFTMFALRLQRSLIA